MVLVAALACAGRNGAGAAGSEEAPRAGTARLLRASSQCGERDAGASWVGSDEQYQRAVKELAGATLEEPAAAPKVDFATHGVLRVGMGRRATAGYSLALAEPALTRDGSTVVVRVAWTEPAPDAMTAQVRTSPCLLLAIPREGLREVRVVDQSGTVRGRAGVP